MFSCNATNLALCNTGIGNACNLGIAVNVADAIIMHPGCPHNSGNASNAS